MYLLQLLTGYEFVIIFTYFQIKIHDIYRMVIIQGEIFETKDIVESCMLVNNNEINSGDRTMNYRNA